MPLGAARISFLAKSQVTVVAEVIRRKVGVISYAGAQIDTAQSQFGGASALFDGIDDFLIIPAQSSLDLSGDFTIECWFRPLDVNVNRKLFDFRGVATGFGGDGDLPLGSQILIDHSSSNMRVFLDGANRASGSIGLTNGNWYHIALSRTSGVCEAYLNGSRIVNYSTSDDYSITSYAQPIGASVYVTPGVSFFEGNIDEVRISNTGRYTGTSITVPTTPFVNDDNTLLLLHMDGSDGSITFDDDNGERAPVGVSAVGNAQISTAQSQFGGASASFDGTGDYLEIEDAVVTTQPFTIEFWYRANDTGTSRGIFEHGPGTSTSGYFRIAQNSSNLFHLRTYKSSSVTDLNLFSTTTISTGTWYHVAITKDGNDWKLYIDGSLEDSGTATVGITSSGPFKIGQVQFFSDANAYIDEFRISDSVRYTTGFTVPTSAFTNDANTLMLLHMDGTNGEIDFIDDNGSVRTRVGVRAFGDAQVDTAQSKFGGASLLLDGAGDYLMANDAISTITPTSEFTMEAWVYQNTYQSAGFFFAVNAGSGGAGNFLLVGPNSIYVDGTQYSYSSAITTTATWIHLAYTYDGAGNHEVYIDGTLHHTTSGDSFIANFSGKDFGIGAEFDAPGGGSPGNYIDGNIDELRVSNTVRYTAGFTPATESFVNDANTLLLLHMDGSDGQTTFLDDNGVY